MYQSCLRSAELDPPANGETPETHCSEWKDIQPGPLHVQDILDQYMSTLGKLAGDQVVSSNVNLDALKKAVEGTKLSGSPVFNGSQVDAITGVARFLLNAATEGYRQKQLTKAIGDQNGNVQSVTQALATIVQHDYREGRLHNEETALDAFHNRTTRAADRGQESLAVEMANQEFEDRMREIASKKDAADNYVKAINLIAHAHQDLYEHRKDLGSKDLMKLLWNDLSELGTAIQAMHEAF